MSYIRLSRRATILLHQTQNYRYSSLQLQAVQIRHISYESTFGSFWISVSKSAPVSTFQQGLIDFHDITGLPWWASIILSTCLLRTLITFPLAVYQNHILARLEKISLEMPEIAKQMKVETGMAIRKFKWTENQAKIMYAVSMKKQWNNLIIRENCHPAKSMIIIWAQIPLWIIQSVSIRNLLTMMPDPSALQAKLVYTELTLGGFGFIPNLTEIDSSLILPVSLGIINLMIIEIQNANRKNTVPSKFQKTVTWFFRGFTIVMVPIASIMPSGLCLYWTTSSAYGLCQNLLLMSPKFKRFVKIPKLPSEHDNPYENIKTVFKEKLDKISKLKA